MLQKSEMVLNIMFDETRRSIKGIAFEIKTQFHYMQNPQFSPQ